jgi:predicted phage tail protein
MPLSRIQTTLFSGDISDSVLRSLLVPPAPTGLTVTGGNAQATVLWTAPAIVVPPLTDYSVQFSTDGGTTWTTATDAVSTATSATVTGLTNGTAYVFRVAAINGIGTGPYTAESSSVTPIAGTPPNAPTSLAATAGNAQLALSWTAPSAPGTSAITGYSVEYTPSGGSAQTVSTGSTATSYTLTGLTNGTAYTVRVAGVSAVGTGTFTAASSSVTPSAAPPVTLHAAFGAVTGSGTVASKWAWQSGSGFFTTDGTFKLLTAGASLTLQATLSQTGGGGCDNGESVGLGIYSAANARIRTVSSNPESLTAGQYISMELGCAHARAEVWVV